MAPAAIALICLAASIVVAMTRRWERISGFLALVGFGTVAGVALFAAPSPDVMFGTATFVDNAWMRAWIGIAAATSGGAWLLSALGRPLWKGRPAALVQAGAARGPNWWQRLARWWQGPPEVIEIAVENLGETETAADGEGDEQYQRPDETPVEVVWEVTAEDVEAAEGSQTTADGERTDTSEADVVAPAEEGADFEEAGAEAAAGAPSAGAAESSTADTEPGATATGSRRRWAAIWPWRRRSPGPDAISLADAEPTDEQPGSDAPVAGDDADEDLAAPDTEPSGDGEPDVEGHQWDSDDPEDRDLSSAGAEDDDASSAPEDDEPSEPPRAGDRSEPADGSDTDSSATADEGPTAASPEEAGATRPGLVQRLRARFAARGAVSQKDGEPDPAAETPVESGTSPDSAAIGPSDVVQSPPLALEEGAETTAEAAEAAPVGDEVLVLPDETGEPLEQADATEEETLPEAIDWVVTFPEEPAGPPPPEWLDPVPPGRHADGAAATLLLLGALTLALGVDQPAVAVLLACAGGFGALGLVRSTGVGADVGWAVLPWFRTAVVVPGLALLAVLLVPADSPAIVVAFCLMAIALAVRLGIVPLHLAPLRLAAVSPLHAAPTQATWIPATLGLVALAWKASIIVVQPIPEPVRYTLVVLAGLTVALAAVAMLLQDDYGRMVAAAAGAAMAPAILAFASDSPDRTAVRTLLLVGATGATALAGWAACARLTTADRRNSTSAGWLRRRPSLGLILVVVVAGMAGWPGTAVWEARRAIVDGAVSGPLETAILVALVLAALGPLRQFIAGFRHPINPDAGTGPWRSLFAWMIALALASVPLVVDAAGPAFQAAVTAPSLFPRL